MKQDEIERTLSEETGIVPSSGFVSGVMAAVLREASAPPPIPFPWKRALPALAAGALAFVAMIIAVVKNAGRPPAAAGIAAARIHDGLLPVMAQVSEIAKMYGIGWILLTILVTLACVTLSMRLVTGTWRTL
jgi:hypothetical protein